MEWWHRRRSVERVKEGRGTPTKHTDVIKTSSEKLRAARHCVIHTASRNFSRHVSRGDGPPSTSLWRRGWGLTCWRFLLCSCVSILERALAAIFVSPQKKKSRSFFFANSVTHIKRRRVYFVWSKGPNSPSGAVVRVRCDWLINRMCATPLNSDSLKSYDLTNICQFQGAPSLYCF